MNQEMGMQAPDTGQQAMAQTAQGGENAEGPPDQGGSGQAPPVQAQVQMNAPADAPMNNAPGPKDGATAYGSGEGGKEAADCSCGGHETDYGAAGGQEAQGAGPFEGAPMNQGPSAGNPGPAAMNPGYAGFQGSQAGPREACGATYQPPYSGQPPLQYHQQAPSMGYSQMAQPQMGHPQMPGATGQPQMPHMTQGHGGCGGHGGHMGGAAQHVQHDQNQFGQMADAVGRFLRGEATPTDMVNGIFSLDFRNDQLWKGALLGAAAVLIFNSGVVQNSIGKLFGSDKDDPSDA